MVMVSPIVLCSACYAGLEMVDVLIYNQYISMYRAARCIECYGLEGCNAADAIGMSRSECDSLVKRWRRKHGSILS